MKAILSRKWFGIPVLVVVVGATAILAAGGVLAATAFNFHGTGAVGSSGTPPPGGGGTPLTYDFVVGANPSAGTVATDATFSFDTATTTMLRGGVYTKTVYLKKTGTAATFNVAVTASNVSTGITVAAPSPITLTESAATTPIAVPITFTVDANAPFAPVAWDIGFSLVP